MLNLGGLMQTDFVLHKIVLKLYARQIFPLIKQMMLELEKVDYKAPDSSTNPLWRTFSDYANLL